MAGRNKDIDEKDLRLWRAVTGDVTPLEGRALPEETVVAVEKPAKRGAVRTPAAAAPLPRPPATPPAEPSVDRRTEQKFARGQMPIEAALDLHGHTQSEAYDALHNFITGCQRQNMRCVLVITGKGKIGEGVLKKRVPEWLAMAPLQSLVLRVRLARGHHGGEGACYVLLKRNRAVQR